MINLHLKALSIKFAFSTVLFLSLQTNAQQSTSNIVYPLGSFSLDSNTEWLASAFAGKIPDTVRLIGLGEVTHGGHETAQVKAKLVQFLVEKQQVRTFLFEYPNAALSLLNYCLQESKYTSEDTVKLTAAYAFSNSLFDAALLDLLIWIKRYNLSHPDEMVSLKGVNIRGASGSFSNYFRNNFFPLLDTVSKNKLDSEWNKVSIDTITMELIAWSTNHKELMQAKLKGFYADFLYNVKNAREDIANKKRSKADFYGSLYQRDSMMAMNVKELADSKSVFWAHNMHVSTASFLLNAGNMLKKDWGDRYYTIATDFSQKANVFVLKDNALIGKSFLPGKKTLSSRALQKFNAGQGIFFYDDWAKVARPPLLMSSINAYGIQTVFGEGKGFDAIVILKTINPTKFNH